MTNKDELVALAADQVLGHAFAAAPHPEEGADAELRALAIAVLDALDRHPWAAFHVNTPPTLANTLHLLDRVGTLVARTGLPAEQHFAVSTAISYYITGVSAQIVAPRATAGAATSRDAFLTQTAESGEKLDPADYPFLTRTTTELRDHDDRDQFTTGLDLFLDGLSSTADPRPSA
ncbi:TetR/AcrR family transcriptional regulator C-terminal domain-containing protein [Streptomyces sp. NBC_01186]|uniref:TetR/AcrR family transcriptional regulator C-terminal domain-containing protein n=1 Tax=Streptomyces sp. NBC_01186 TaxID=2903765 RepID=UPI002E111128|nr:TetR/AcrR family transcriptional regulator C-terminal domain-containing protein [Streptomyces sp. NBC_01186]